MDALKAKMIRNCEGPGGLTCPCCNPVYSASHNNKTRFKRNAKRSVKNRQKQNLLKEME